MSLRLDAPVKLSGATTSVRDALASPGAGDSLYNTDLKLPNYYDGSNWRVHSIDSRETMGDADLTINQLTRFVEATTTFTSIRIATLPAASGVPAGAAIVVRDNGAANGSNVLLVARAGSDTINGGTGAVIIGSGVATIFVSNGSNGYLVVGRYQDVLGITNGGTNASTAQGAINALSPLTTRGDIMVRDATNTTRLGKGTTGQFLKQGANDPAWATLVYGDISTGDIATTGGIKSSSSSLGVGYATGAGGSVTQGTSKTTSVTINKICGAVTTHNAALASNAQVVFTVNNSAFAAADFVGVCLASGLATAGTYQTWISNTAPGAFNIVLKNISGGSLSESIVIVFTIIKTVFA